VGMYLYFEKESCELLGIRYLDNYPDIFGNDDSSENKKDIYTDNIKYVHHILLDNIKIDIVITTINSLEFIKTSFDLDCCQRAYNGETLYYPHDNFPKSQIVRLSKIL